MKLWKMCWYDIKNGCLKNIKLLLFPIVYEIVVLFAMMQKVVSYEKYGMEVEKHLGDILLYNFGGMPKYVLSAETVFARGLRKVTWDTPFIMCIRTVGINVVIFDAERERTFSK